MSGRTDSDDAIVRCHDHRHAVRILARAWLSVMWQCWQHKTAYDPAQHRVPQRILSQDPNLDKLIDLPRAVRPPLTRFHIRIVLHERSAIRRRCMPNANGAASLAPLRWNRYAGNASTV
jgi:hypothetical protein